MTEKHRPTDLERRVGGIFHEPPPRIPQSKPSEGTRRIIHERTARTMEAVQERDLDITDHCDIRIKVTDGRPVLVEITSKHKPTV